MHVLILYAIMFILSILFIYKGSKMLIDASIVLGDISGVHGFLIGVTIVSMATTIPELMVSSIATVQGSIDMATGNAIGSVICNEGFIMGIAIFMMPVKINNNLFTRRGVYLTLTSALLGILISDGSMSIWDSLLLLAVLTFFVSSNLLLGRNAIAEMEPKRRLKSIPPGKNEIIKKIVLIILGIAMLLVGAKLMVDSCTAFVNRIGIRQNIIGLTIMSLGTSLPEVLTTVISIMSGELELASGNILGSSIINIALILPICCILNGGTLPMNAQLLMLDIPVMLIVLMIVIIPGMIRNRLSRVQGGVLMTVLFLYMTYLMGQM